MSEITLFCTSGVSLSTSICAVFMFASATCRFANAVFNCSRYTLSSIRNNDLPGIHISTFIHKYTGKVSIHLCPDLNIHFTFNGSRVFFICCC